MDRLEALELIPLPKRKKTDAELLDDELRETTAMIETAINEERISEPTPAVTVYAPGSGPEVVQTAEPERAGKTAGTHPEPEKTSSQSGIRIAFGIVAGIPAMVAVLLIVTMYLASKGIYVEILRPFWVPVPSEDVKWILAVAVIFVSLWAAIRRDRR